MQSELTSTLRDFIMSAFWIGAIVAIWYLVLILRKLYLTVKDVSEIIEHNRKNIDQTLNEVPAITKNVQEITTEVAHDVQVFRPTVDNIAETSEAVTGKIKDNNSVNEALGSFFHTLQIIKSTLDKFNEKLH